MRHYATLFDSRYLPQGLVLYESLKKHSSEPFTLYVLPMDQETVDMLTAMVLPNVHMVLGFHESHHGMKEARSNRTHAEYCFTCASNFCEALLNTGLDEINYIDADCVFMAATAPIFEEIGTRSIGIVPHRFTDNAERPRLEKSGRFNVSLVHFKNTSVGRECVSKWAAQCRERCSVDTCGDQLYLNRWDSEYGKECAVIENIGVGVAPWNFAQYEITSDGERTYVDGVPIVMVHAHEFRQNADGTFRLTNYPVRSEEREFIYRSYVASVVSAKARIAALENCHSI